MATGKNLLQIIEGNVDGIQDAVARRFRNSGRAVFDNFDFDGLRTLAWSHIDPIIQSLRYEDDFLFTFFLDYSSGRSAEEGLPMEDSLHTLSLVSDTIWEFGVAESAPEDLAENLSRLVSILGKGKEGIATNYMTQRDQALDELQESNDKLMEDTKRKLNFLAKVSHELKTPLTSVIAYSEQLLDEGLPGEIRSEFNRVVHDQSSKLLQLIEDLMELSKFQNDRSRLNLSWADPVTVIEEAIGTVQMRADQKEVGIGLDPPADLPRVYMDPFRIQQVVWNLLTNGVKYNESGGEVRVSAAVVDQELTLVVKDNGIGIKPENQELIFQSFHQTEDALAMVEGGAGLGLDIVRHYLGLHKGRISVESVYGEGSTFTVYLPLGGPDGLDPEEAKAQLEAETEPAPITESELQSEMS
jgi:signal transduction histidine kinase